MVSIVLLVETNLVLEKIHVSFVLSDGLQM